MTMLRNARDPIPGEVVEVYRNLNSRCWSVRAGGLVVAHLPEAWLRDVRWVVRESGRQRVLKSGVKNVHAFARGEWMTQVPRLALALGACPQGVTYDPRRFETFVDATTLEPCESNAFAHFTPGMTVVGWR